MTIERVQRILRDHGVETSTADAARLLDAYVPLARAALRVGTLPAPPARAGTGSPAPPPLPRPEPRRASRPQPVP